MYKLALLSTFVLLLSACGGGGGGSDGAVETVYTDTYKFVTGDELEYVVIGEYDNNYLSGKALYTVGDQYDSGCYDVVMTIVAKYEQDETVNDFLVYQRELARIDDDRYYRCAKQKNGIFVYTISESGTAMPLDLEVGHVYYTAQYFDDDSYINCTVTATDRADFYIPDDGAVKIPATLLHTWCVDDLGKESQKHTWLADNNLIVAQTLYGPKTTITLSLVEVTRL